VSFLALFRSITATGGGASWIRLSVDLSVGLEERLVGVGGVFMGFWHNPDTVFVLLWHPGMTLLLFLSSDVSLSVEDILVESEVWHEVILVILGSLDLGLSGGNPLVLEELLGTLGVSQGGLDVRINSEVGDRVILFVLTSFYLGLGGGNPLVAEVGFRLLDVVLSDNDVGVNSEVWHFVVDGVALRLLERGIHWLSDRTLSKLEVFLGGLDFRVYSEVRDNIVVGVVWVSVFSNRGGFVPRGSSLEWSILGSLDFVSQEGQSDRSHYR